jgi:UTP--glucose-1-phosphate uridylyltransferase
MGGELGKVQPKLSGVCWLARWSGAHGTFFRFVSKTLLESPSHADSEEASGVRRVAMSPKRPDRVRKAILPVAGLGTRMLPATKVLPKELLPLLGKPILQYAVEECLASEVGELILVTSREKRLIEDYFSPAPRLERLLERQGRRRLAAQLRRLGRLARLHYVHQPKPSGLGHAVLCARRQVANEPFAVLLSDVFIDGARPALRQLLEVYARVGASVVAVEHVPRERVGQCGIVKVQPASASGHLLRVLDVVEKPEPCRAPSNLGIVGRYVLTPEIFRCLARTAPDSRGEIQLTDALALLAREGTLYAFVCEGKSFDAGDDRGLLELTVRMALRDPQLGLWFRRLLRSLEPSPRRS